MKLKNVPGELAFRALVDDDGCWVLTDVYFFTKQEVLDYAGDSSIVWPVEIWEDGTCYVPSQEELE